MMVSAPAFAVGYGTVRMVTASVAEQLPILAVTWKVVVPAGVAIGFAKVASFK